MGWFRQIYNTLLLFSYLSISIISAADNVSGMLLCVSDVFRSGDMTFGPRRTYEIASIIGPTCNVKVLCNQLRQSVSQSVPYLSQKQL